MPTYEFEHYLPSDTPIHVEADITPLDPGRTYGPPEDCYPPEGGYAEITKTEVRVGIVYTEVDLNDLYLKTGKDNYEHFPDYLADIAYEKWCDDNQ